MKALDDDNFACGIFVDLQKAFCTADPSILLSKLCKYRIRGLVKNWFVSCLADLQQVVSINGFASSITSTACVVPQEYVLGSLLFLL